MIGSSINGTFLQPDPRANQGAALARAVFHSASHSFYLRPSDRFSEIRIVLGRGNGYGGHVTSDAIWRLNSGTEIPSKGLTLTVDMEFVSL